MIHFEVSFCGLFIDEEETEAVKMADGWCCLDATKVILNRGILAYFACKLLQFSIYIIYSLWIYAHTN